MNSDQIEKLREFVAYYTQCPCCIESVKCSDGCTFKHDAPQDAEVMQQARDAMKAAQ